MQIKQITAQLYTLRDFLKTPQEIRSSLKRVKEIGYSSVQVSGLGPIGSHELKKITDDFELEIVVTHIPYIRFKEDLDSLIAEHKLWGCENVGLGSMPKEYIEQGKEGYKKFAEEFSRIGKKLSEYGLRFVYHNHKFEFQKYDGITGMEILLNETDPDGFDFEIDTYWVQAGGADPVEWIKKVKSRMQVVHLKDMAILNNEQIFAEIGEGNLDWDKILDACKETGVKWYAVEQDKCLKDPFESMKISFDYLKNKGDRP